MSRFLARRLIVATAAALLMLFIGPMLVNSPSLRLALLLVVVVLVVTAWRGLARRE
jgi:hypothetical protein